MTHTIRLIRLKFIDTADEEPTWILNVKRQWEGGSKIALRVVCGTKTIGITPPKMLQWYPFTGLTWETEFASGATFAVDFSTESPNVLFEVVGLAKPPGTVLGLVFWSAESFIGSDRQYTRQTLHVFRTGIAVKKSKDTPSIHAVIEVEVQALSRPPTPAAGSRSISQVSSPRNNSNLGSSLPDPSPLLTGTSPSAATPSATTTPQSTTVTASSNRHYRRTFLAASPEDKTNLTITSSNAHLTTDIPLSYTFGLVRTSVLDLYFPNQLLSEGTIVSNTAIAAVSGGGGSTPTSPGVSPGASPKVAATVGSNFSLATPNHATLGGSIIVSNVICVANLSEKVNLSMQLVTRGSGGAETSSAFVFNPSGGVIVLPNQKAFFSVTWNPMKALAPNLVEDIQLLLSGPGVSPAPVTFRVHFNVPKNNELYSPYHYWANGTLITNRSINMHRELPFIRSVLPIFILQQGSGGSATSSGNLGRSSGEYYGTLAGAQMSAEGEAGDDWLMVRDADTGLNRKVVSSGAVGPALLPDGTRLDAAGANSSSSSGFLSGAWNAISGSKNKKHVATINTPNSDTLQRLAIRSWTDQHAKCTLQLGSLFGFPMMTSSSTGEGAAPSFKIMAQSLSSAWQIEGSEDTQEVYQTLSGTLRWSSDDHISLKKAPNAPTAQFLRLTLMECAPSDRDETPIAAGIVSLSTEAASPLQPVPVFLAFYVYDTFSLYDQLPTSSLIMKGAAMRFGYV